MRAQEKRSVSSKSRSSPPRPQPLDAPFAKEQERIAEGQQRRDLPVRGGEGDLPAPAARRREVGRSGRAVTDFARLPRIRQPEPVPVESGAVERGDRGDGQPARAQQRAARAVREQVRLAAVIDARAGRDTREADGALFRARRRADVHGAARAVHGDPFARRKRRERRLPRGQVHGHTAGPNGGPAREAAQQRRGRRAADGGGVPLPLHLRRALGHSEGRQRSFRNDHTHLRIRSRPPRSRQAQARASR